MKRCSSSDSYTEKTRDCADMTWYGRHRPSSFQTRAAATEFVRSLTVDNRKTNLAGRTP